MLEKAFDILGNVPQDEQDRWSFKQDEVCELNGWDGYTLTRNGKIIAEYVYRDPDPDNDPDREPQDGDDDGNLGWHEVDKEGNNWNAIGTDEEMVECLKDEIENAMPEEEDEEEEEAEQWSYEDTRQHIADGTPEAMAGCDVEAIAKEWGITAETTRDELPDLVSKAYKTDQDDMEDGHVLDYDAYYDVLTECWEYVRKVSVDA